MDYIHDSCHNENWDEFGKNQIYSLKIYVKKSLYLGNRWSKSIQKIQNIYCWPGAVVESYS